MFKKDTTFLGVAILLLVLPVILFGLMASPESPIVEPPRSEKSKRMQSPYSHPDEFNKAFADMRGLNHGYEAAPHNYKMVEFRRALERNAKRGQSQQLNWVERGPGNLGGRTRAIVVDPDDPTLNTWYVGAVGGGVWKGKRYIDAFDQERLSGLR